MVGTSWEGLHPHAFRHLVATEMDNAGKSAREIADYLGHEKVSMTQDVCIGWTASPQAARRPKRWTSSIRGADPTVGKKWGLILN